jgi:hypothetical protein
LTNKEKFRELERLIQAAVARAVPELLASE